MTSSQGKFLWLHLIPADGLDCSALRAEVFTSSAASS
jgi:hypothetical protein